MSQPVVRFLKVSKSFIYFKEREDNIKGLVAQFMQKGSVATTIQVLRSISFEINEGEFVGIMGRNGTGKSTILKLIAGIYTANEGYVQTKGVIAPLIELGAGFSGDLSGLENVYLNASILGFKKKDVDLALPEIIDFSELGEKIHMPVKNYSSGMLVRLGFSIATHLPANIMLIDEVLAVGDVGFQRKCLRKIDQLHKQGRTIILVTHNPHDIAKYCQRCIVIESTGKAYDGPAVKGVEIYDHFSKTWGWLPPDIRKLIEAGIPFDEATEKANQDSNRQLKSLVRPVFDLSCLGISEQTLSWSNQDFQSWQKKAKLDYVTAPFLHKTAVEHFFCEQMIEKFGNCEKGLYVVHGSDEFKDAFQALHPEAHVQVFCPFDPNHVFKKDQTHESGRLTEAKVLDSSLDFIVIQHAFKHFKQTLDSVVIQDVARLLKPGGVCVVLPVFIGDKAIEVWNDKPNFDAQDGFESHFSIDNVFAGSEIEGNFARIYDMKAFQFRVLKTAEESRLRAQLIRCQIDNVDQPDQKMNYSFYLDKPMRALILQKLD